MLNIFYIS